MVVVEVEGVFFWASRRSKQAWCFESGSELASADKMALVRLAPLGPFTLLSFENREQEEEDEEVNELDEACWLP